LKIIIDATEHNVHVTNCHQVKAPTSYNMPVMAIHCLKTNDEILSIVTIAVHITASINNHCAMCGAILIGFIATLTVYSPIERVRNCSSYRTRK